MIDRGERTSSPAIPAPRRVYPYRYGPRPAAARASILFYGESTMPSSTALPKATMPKALKWVFQPFLVKRERAVPSDRPTLVLPFVLAGSSAGGTHLGSSRCGTPLLPT